MIVFRSILFERRDRTPSCRDSFGLTGMRSTWKREARERQGGAPCPSATVASCMVSIGSRNPQRVFPYGLGKYDGDGFLNSCT